MNLLIQLGLNKARTDTFRTTQLGEGNPGQQCLRLPLFFMILCYDPFSLADYKYVLVALRKSPAILYIIGHVVENLSVSPF